jgi:hypothetical protein
MEYWSGGVMGKTRKKQTQYSSTPVLQHSITPILQYSNISAFAARGAFSHASKS